MRKLACEIEEKLQKHGAFAVYNSDLARLWPPTMDPAKRKREIASFAKRHRFAVTFFEVGLCAVFEKPGKSRRRSKPASN